MTRPAPANAAESFRSFGAYLRFLRRRARLTQRELAIAVNYSEGQICHLERGRRAPELTTLIALFVPALHLEHAAEESARLLALAAAHHATQPAPSNPPVHQPAAGVAPSAPAGSDIVARAPLPPSPLIGRSSQRAMIHELLTTATRA